MFLSKFLVWGCFLGSFSPITSGDNIIIENCVFSIKHDYDIGLYDNTDKSPLYFFDEVVLYGNVIKSYSGGDCVFSFTSCNINTYQFKKFSENYPEYNILINSSSYDYGGVVSFSDLSNVEKCYFHSYISDWTVYNTINYYSFNTFVFQYEFQPNIVSGHTIYSCGSLPSMGFNFDNAVHTIDRKLDVNLISYNGGYEKGYPIGYNDGKNQGYDVGYHTAFDIFVDRLGLSNTFLAIILKFFFFPVEVFLNMYGFVFAGYDLTLFFYVLSNILLVAYIYMVVFKFIKANGGSK